jgi:feruloyl esterase
VVYRLPASWNGKVLGIGGGGWMATPRSRPRPKACARATRRCRPTPGTRRQRLGHELGGNPEAAKDFAWRGIHEMTVAGKQLVAAYYGQPHRRAYYQGCSTGGRMG